MVTILIDHGFNLREATHKFQKIVLYDNLRDVYYHVDRVLIGMFYAEFLLYYPLASNIVDLLKVNMPKTYKIIEKISNVIRDINLNSPSSQRLCQVALVKLFDSLAKVNPTLAELVIFWMRDTTIGFNGLTQNQRSKGICTLL